MSPEMQSRSVAELVDALEDLHAASSDAGALPVASLAAELRMIARARGLLDSLEATRLRAFDARQEFRADLSVSAASWLGHHLRLDPGDAQARVAAARLLADLPETARALAAGEVSFGHVQAMAKGVRRVGLEPVREAEPALLGLAATARPRDVQVAVGRIVEVLGADDSAVERAQRQRAARHVFLSHGIAGSWTLEGLLDFSDGALVDSALSAFAGFEPLPDGSPDPRSAGARTADALVTIARMALDGRDAPQVAGVSPHVSLVLDLEAVRAAVQSSGAVGAVGAIPAPRSAADYPGRPATGLLASALTRSFGPHALARLTCHASLTPVLVGEVGEPLALGRSARLASPHQVKMLWVRDGGCIAPGCGTRWVQVHHIVHWADGGLTDVDDMVLICERHHHLVHDDGWRVEHDPVQPGSMIFRHPDRLVTVPAVHAVDRNLGATVALPFVE